MIFYDKISKSYDKLYGEEQKQKFSFALHKVKFNFKGKILDAGCGTGLFEEFIIKRMDGNSLFFCVDFSKKLLEKAKKKHRVKENIFLVCADIDKLPFPNNFFDVCVIFTVFQNLPNPNQTLEEIKRVCRKNALLVTTYLKTETNLENFKNFLGKIGFKPEVFDPPHLNEYVGFCKIFK